MDIKYRLEVFEGPLDLLLHLINKNKVSIYDIPIIEITNQYLDAVAFIDEEKLENSSEFIIMAVQLLYIKSRMLLPKEEEAEEEEDPREALAKRIEEYARLKNAALKLRSREFYDFECYYRNEEAMAFEAPVYDKRHELGDLAAAINDILERKRRRTEPEKRSFFGIVGREKVPIADMEKKVRQMLLERRRLAFSEVFSKKRSKPERIATFLALLEMIKENKITADYSDEEHEYIITRGQSDMPNMYRSEGNDV
ncbi:MAG: segregation/condensation protein A [Oscillospiraceae bacterium]|nr:segregation/condensation protein A [Oscillospiraceae bacterium]